jgi:hypothetical protein
LAGTVPSMVGPEGLDGSGPEAIVQVVLQGTITKTQSAMCDPQPEITDSES